MATARKDQKKAPAVRATIRGTMESVLEIPAEKHREENPEYGLRWVFAPEDTPNMIKFIQRQAQGYSPVSVEEAGIEGFGKAGDLIRAGDVVLCKIPIEMQDARRAELSELATAEARRPADAYRDSIRRTAAGAGSVVAATGDITSRVEDRELTFPEGD